VARTVYLGSAPMTASANRGIEDRRIRLGCVMPGETPAVFGDALRRLAASPNYLYQDGPRYWYATQPTVTKLADDRAEQLRRDPDKVVEEIEKRLRADLRQAGDFVAIHPLPQTSADVPDNHDVRLVVLGPDHVYSKDAANKASAAAAVFLQSRGNAPRLFQNTLAFLAPDAARLQDLDDAVRRYIAWPSILAETDQLNLDPHQEKQAQNQLKAVDGAVIARLPETYQWLLVPVQDAPTDKIGWETLRLTGQEPLAVRASKKMRSQDLLFLSLSGTRLRMDLDRIPLWRGDHVPVTQLTEDFARYVYLPRLRDPQVLMASIQDGLALLLWREESFAYADGFDEIRARYRGLRGGQRVEGLGLGGEGMLVRSEVATNQQTADTPPPARPPGGFADPPSGDGGIAGDPSPSGPGPSPQPAARAQPTRYYGSVTLDPARVGRDAGRIAEEVIAHLSALVGGEVTIRLEISADIPDGVPENVVRTVTENGRTLKFSSQGFEQG